MHEIGDIDRVFNTFIHKISHIPKNELIKLPKDNSEIIANQTQAFNEHMYNKYNYDKLNETLFIPVKPSMQNPNYSQSTNISSRILSAKPKAALVITDQSVAGTTLMKTVSECLKPINTNMNDNLTSFMVGSPINEMGSPETKSFSNENEFKEKETFTRKKKRVMSAKYERKGYLKVRDKISYDEGSSSFGLISQSYHPKQLTTDKCKKTIFFFF